MRSSLFSSFKRCLYRRNSQARHFNSGHTPATSFIRFPSKAIGALLFSFGLYFSSSERVLEKVFGLKEVNLESELPPTITHRALTKINHFTLAWREFLNHPILSIASSHLTQETLRGPHLIEAEFTGNLTKVLYLGSDLCGHKGIIHGGLIATILQEACREFTNNTGPNCKPTYSINYKAPVFADQCVTITAKEPIDSPRGLIITAELLDKSGKLLSNITAIFPKK